MSLRSIFAAALVAALAVPTGALAQRGPASTTTTTAPALSFGGGVGMEFGDMDGFGLRVDGIYPLQNLTPEVTLALVGSLGFTRFSEELGGGFDLNANVFKLVPAARFGFAVSPQLSLYGDAGLGLYYGTMSIDPDPGDFVELDDSEIGFLMRLAAGALYSVSPRFQLGGELGLNPYFGDQADDNTISLFVTAVYKM